MYFQLKNAGFLLTIILFIALHFINVVSLLLIVWIGAQLPQEKFISSGRFLLSYITIIVIMSTNPYTYYFITLLCLILLLLYLLTLLLGLVLIITIIIITSNAGDLRGNRIQ